MLILDVRIGDENVADKVRIATSGTTRGTNYAGARDFFHLLYDKPFQGDFFADVFGVLTVNVPDDSEWFGWCSFDPYFDTLNVVACATGALENLCISDERVNIESQQSSLRGVRQETKSKVVVSNQSPFNKNADNASIAGEASLFVCMLDHSNRGLRELLTTF